MSIACEKCNDTGKVVTNHKPGPEVAITGGGSVQCAGGFSTDLCECRRKLPRRHGKASFWVFDTPITFEEEIGPCLRIGVQFQPELPVSTDGYPLHRTLDNAYYPPSIKFAFDGFPLNADELRAMADFCTRMAGKAEELDVIVPDEQSPERSGQ